MMSGSARRFPSLAATAAVLAVLASAPASAGMLEVGQGFPAFELRDHTGALVRSADLAGKPYLLWFYPKALTPGCTTEARRIRDRRQDFEGSGLVVLGVSFDDPDDNREFVEDENLPFRLLSDKDRALAVAVGAAESPKAWYARRISYLVGPDGKVVKAYDDVDPDSHAAEVLADWAAAAASIPVAPAVPSAPAAAVDPAPPALPAAAEPPHQ